MNAHLGIGAKALLKERICCCVGMCLVKGILSSGRAAPKEHIRVREALRAQGYFGIPNLGSEFGLWDVFSAWKLNTEG